MTLPGSGTYPAGHTATPVTLPVQETLTRPPRHRLCRAHRHARDLASPGNAHAATQAQALPGTPPRPARHLGWHRRTAPRGQGQKNTPCLHRGCLHQKCSLITDLDGAAPPFQCQEIQSRKAPGTSQPFLFRTDRGSAVTGRRISARSPSTTGSSSFRMRP